MLARKLTVAIVLAALGLSACGSSSKSAGSTATTIAGTAGSQPSSGDTSTTAKPTAAEAAVVVAAISAALMRKDDSAFKGADIATKSAGDLKDLYKNVVPELDRAKSEAPDAIKSDFATLVTGMKALVKALETANYDVTKLNTDSFKNLSDPKFETASQNIATYLSQHCGIKDN